MKKESKDNITLSDFFKSLEDLWIVCHEKLGEHGDKGFGMLMTLVGWKLTKMVDEKMRKNYQIIPTRVEKIVGDE